MMICKIGIRSRIVACCRTGKCELAWISLCCLCTWLCQLLSHIWTVNKRNTNRSYLRLL
jgi:hypothetical protein